MTDGTAGDEVHQPTGSSDEQDAAAEPDPHDTVGQRSQDEVLDDGYSPPERPLGVDRTGTTAAEQREGESLDERLAQEVPEPGTGTGSGPDGPSRTER